MRNLTIRTSAGCETSALRAWRSRIGASLLIAVGAALGGCGQSHVDSPDASEDAAIDRPDSTTAEDGGPAPDAGSPDEDADGIASHLDCDDTDASVGSTSTRSCTTACDVGLERCTDGAWAECDATAECDCPTIGMTRTLPCGRCGLASQTCGADGVWSLPGECLGESECFEGDVERAIERCGEQARICDDTCHWREWTEVTPPGECDAGKSSSTADGCPAGNLRELTCSAACAWEESRPCEAACALPPRTSLSGADPVCIPAGPFVLGSNEPDDVVGSSARPERMVVLSEFYIDRYPVTRARYEMCIAAGACPPPTGAYVTYYEMHPMSSFPGNAPANAGEAFCAWDGGALVTEFQWEKAARGVYPDRRLHSWGTDGVDPCRTHPAPACPDGFFSITASQFPDAVSPYGVRMMGSLLERTRTPYSFTLNSTHAWITDGETDPVPGTTSPAHTVRGAIWQDGTYRPREGSAVRRQSAASPSRSGFRCAY